MRRTKDGKDNELLRGKNGVSVIPVAVFCVIILLTVFAVSVVSDERYNIFGYTLRIVMSSSMEKNPQTDVSNYRIKDIPPNSLIVIELVPDNPDKARDWYAKLERGDVLTFVYGIFGENVTVTHRIRNIVEKNSGYIITLAGDNVYPAHTSEQVLDTSDENGGRVIGKVVYTNCFLGTLLIVLRNPGFIAAMTTFLFLAVFFVGVLKKERA